MRSSEPRLALARRAAWLPLAFLFLSLLPLSSCEQQDTETFLDLRSLADSLDRYDSVVVVVKTPEGEVLDTAFRGKVVSGSTLAELPVPHYQGGKAVISITGYLEGEMAYRADRHYDGSRRATELVVPIILPNSAVALAQADTLLIVGESSPLPEVSVTPENLADKRHSWSSSDPDIVALEQGRYVGLRTGSAELRARLDADTGKRAGFRVRVAAPPAGKEPDSVRIARDSVEVRVGGAREALLARVYPAEADTALLWSVGDAGVARLVNGSVEGLKPGTTWVTARSLEYPGRADSVRVVVLEKLRSDSLVVLILEPADQAYVNKSSIEVVWTVDGETQTAFSRQNLTEGRNVIVRTARDSAGNADSDSVTVYLDTQAPQAPQVRGQTPSQSGTPLWTWSGSGGGNGRYRFRLDNESLDGQPETRDTSYRPIVNLDERSHTLVVQERDAAGNWSSSGYFSIRIDQSPPRPPQVSVAGPSFTGNPRPAWTWTGDSLDGIGVYRVRLDANDFSQGADTLAGTDYAPGRDLADGTHFLFVQERDSAGNWSLSRSAAVTIALLPPDAPLVTAIPASPTNVRRPTWSWKSGTRKGMGIFRRSLDSAALGSMPGDTSTRFTPGQDLPEGLATLYVQELDSAGRYSPPGRQSVLIDLTPPNPPRVASAAARTTQARPTWSWTSGGGGAGRYRYRLDSPVFAPDAPGSSEAAFTPSEALEAGSHVLYVQERDSAGNWSGTGGFAVRVVGGTGYIVGDLGLILKSSDAGATWEWKSGGAIRCVRFVDANTGYAVGDAGLILKTIDGGARWSVQPSQTSQTLNAVFFLNANTGYAAGWGGAILKTADGGATWTALASGTVQPLYAIHFSGPSTGYALGGSPDEILKTENAGETWVPQANPTRNSLASVFFADSRIGYAVGVSGAIAKTTNAGGLWSAQASGTSNSLNAVCFTDTSVGYAVGMSGTILKTVDGGATWTPQSSGTTQGLYTVHFRDRNLGFAAGDGGILLKTTNGGSTWMFMSSGTTQGLRSIFFADGTIGYAGGLSGTMLKSISTGSLWSVLNSGLTTNHYAVQFTGAGTGYALGGTGVVGGGGYILKSADAGNRWAALPSGTSQYLFGIHFLNPDTGFAVGDGGTILRTDNAGANWTPQNSGTVQNLSAVHFTDARTGYAVGGGGTILKTSNGGTLWSPLSSGSTQNLRSVVFTDSGAGYVAGYGGTVLKTVNGGATWTPQSSGTAQNLNSIFPLDSRVGFAAGFNGTLLKTTDGGGLWTPVPGIPAKFLSGIFFLDDKIGFAAGNEGTLLRTDDGGTTWTQPFHLSGMNFRAVYFP